MKIDNIKDMTFTKNEEEQKSKEETKEMIESPEEIKIVETGFIPEEEDTDQRRMAYFKILNNFMKEENYSHNMILKGKVISLMDSIKHNKGIVVTGPRCSGKTSIIKGLGYLLKNSETNTEMRISVLNPDVYSLEKLYGTADSGVMNPEISTNKDVKISSITSSVLDIATKGFSLLSKQKGNKMTNIILDDDEEKTLIDLEEEKQLEVSSEGSQSEDAPVFPKLLKTLLFECSSISPIWSDCLVDFIKESNYTSNMFSP